MVRITFKLLIIDQSNLPLLALSGDLTCAEPHKQVLLNQDLNAACDNYLESSAIKDR